MNPGQEYPEKHTVTVAHFAKYAEVLACIGLPWNNRAELAQVSL